MSNNLIGVNAPKEPALKHPKGPDNSADIYCAVEQTSVGFYLSIWSVKAGVWVKLLNRYLSRAAADAAIDGYGFKPWLSTTPPHLRNVKTPHHDHHLRSLRK